MSTAIHHGRLYPLSVWFNLMSPFPLSPTRLIVVLRIVVWLGLAAAVLGLLTGWIVIGRTSETLLASLELTDDSLEALDASAGLADDTIAALSVSLQTLQDTSTDLDGAFLEGETLMRELADLVRNDVASSISAVDASLPGLINVAGTIDQTLGALSGLPFGPDYNPEENFSDSLVTLSQSLDGLPDRLGEQATLLDSTADSLVEVGDGIGSLSEELATFEAPLSRTAELLSSYDKTIGEGRDLVDQSRTDLEEQLVITRIAVVFTALALAGLQVVPLQMAAMVRQQLRNQGSDVQV